MRAVQRRAKLEPATSIVSMSNRSCRFADWGVHATNASVLVANAGSWLIGIAAQVSIPAGSSEDDQEEGSERRYARCNCDNVAFVTVGNGKLGLRNSLAVLTHSISRA